MKYIKQDKFKPLQDSHQTLKEKIVAVVGLGGLGSHSSEYLVRMGIGTIILIDDDIVEETNLPRQGLYIQEDSEKQRFKADIAAVRLREINPDTMVIPFTGRLNSENILDVLQTVDIVIDGTDNMGTRYLMNDYCYENQIPWVYASATASVGVVINFIPGKTPCLRCVYGDETAEDAVSCDANGIILPALTMITSMQVTEAIKILLHHPASTEELRFNIWTREVSHVDTSIFLEESCRCQTHNATPKSEETSKFYMICDGDTIQVNTTFSLDELESNLQQNGFTVSRKNDMLVDSYKGENHRVIAYKTGKMVCHHMNKESIQQLF